MLIKYTYLCSCLFGCTALASFTTVILDMQRCSQMRKMMANELIEMDEDPQNKTQKVAHLGGGDDCKPGNFQ